MVTFLVVSKTGCSDHIPLLAPFIIDILQAAADGIWLGAGKRFSSPHSFQLLLASPSALIHVTIVMLGRVNWARVGEAETKSGGGTCGDTFVLRNQTWPSNRGRHGIIFHDQKATVQFPL
jgi:hypothetical protein